MCRSTFRICVSGCWITWCLRRFVPFLLRTPVERSEFFSYFRTVMKMTEDDILNHRGFPLLVIGDAVTDFKAVYSGKIEVAESLDEMRELVSYYTSIPVLDRPLVIEDISLFAKNGEGILLKFVEESPLNLILLSRFDSVSSVLLSRVKSVWKYYNDEIDSQFLPVSKGSKMLEDALDEKTHYYSRIRYMGKFSPKQIYLERSIKHSRYRNRIISFVD